MQLQYEYPLRIKKYKTVAKPRRFTVGDVIRCPSFRWGAKENWKRIAPAERAVLVALTDPKTFFTCKHPQDEIIEAYDESRGTALFLVTSIIMYDMGTWPEDAGFLAPRLSRNIRCIRLTDTGLLEKEAERISFNEDPMSLARPDPRKIELVGHI